MGEINPWTGEEVEVLDEATRKRLELLDQIVPPPYGRQSVENMRELHPQLAIMHAQFVMDLVWSRPILDRKTRTFVHIVAFTVQGRFPELKLQTKAALHNGASRDEICEVVLQTAVSAGFPAAWDGLKAVKEAFEEYDKLAGAGT